MVEGLKRSTDGILKDCGLREVESTLNVHGTERPCRVIGLNGEPLLSYGVDSIDGKQTFYIKVSDACSKLTQGQYRTAAAHIYAFVLDQKLDLQEMIFEVSLERVPEDALQSFWNIKPPGRGRVLRGL